MKINLDKREEEELLLGGKPFAVMPSPREAQAEGEQRDDWAGQQAVGSGSGREFYGENKTAKIRTLNGRIGTCRAILSTVFLETYQPTDGYWTGREFGLVGLDLLTRPFSR